MSLLLRVKALAEAVGADIKALANGKVDSNDPRLSDSREWSEDTVTQAEAEAGTASTRRAWTAQRVRQAINAWWQLVTSGFGRNLVSASNEQAARNVLQLTYPATAPTVGDGAEVMRAGAYGLGEQSLSTRRATQLSWDAFFNMNMIAVNSAGPFMSYIGISENTVLILNDDGDSIILNVELFHTGNTLNIGTTPASARAALQLTGEWVDLRPYLKPGFYYDSARVGRNSHPRIRKLSCGRVELDGIVSFNETSGPVPIGVFVNVPAQFRPTLTVGGLMFGDTASPLSFGAVNWIVIGQVEYSPPAVHGDISMIPLTLASPAQSGAISLNGIYWFT